MTVRPKKGVNKDEAMEVARRLVQEAMDVAEKAGIATSSVLAPHCAEAAVNNTGTSEDGSEMLSWCKVPVKIDSSTEGLFEMPELNNDLEQQPAFLVTQATADLVRQDFERYQPSLERMIEDWHEEKAQFMREQANRKRDHAKNAKRAGAPRRK